MSKEFKNYELRTCPRPLTSGYYKSVSNTVKIFGVDGSQYYCYVAFSEKFVQAVGKKLRGVMPSDPAYIYVTVYPNGTYTVRAARFREAGNWAIMWTAPYVEGTPEWLKFIKVKQDGNSPKSAGKSKAARDSDPLRKSGDAT